MSSHVKRLAERKARKYGLGEWFVRQIGQESGFRAHVVSPAGARGAAQIMPATARAWGVNPDRPAQAIDAAAKHMRQYEDEFGNVEDALRAYNAGPGAVRASHGFAETNNYVQRILNGRTPAVSSSSGTPGVAPTAPKWTTTSGFDKAAFERARKQAIVGQLIAKRDPGSLLARLLPTSAPDPADFQTSNTAFSPGDPGMPGVSGTSDRNGRQKGAPEPHGGYAGTKGAVKSFVHEGRDLGLVVTSAKRHNTNPYSGTGSDHDYSNTDAYAADMSNGSRPTPEMDEYALRVARRLGFKDYKKGTPIMRSTTLNGIRYQLIYRGSGEAFGGNHMNHVHLGAKRVG